MTAPAHQQVTFRPAEPSDEQKIGEIAYLTGFFGDSAAIYFPDTELFTALWVRPYLTGGGGASFVAELDSELLGYVLGSGSPVRYRRAVLETVVHFVLPGVLLGRFRQPWRVAYYFLRTLVFPSPHTDEKVFPGHLHLNILPQARGQGLSRPLLERLFQALTAQGVAGVQLSTTLENERALIVYQKHGFKLLAAKRTAFWKPWLGRSAVHVVLARRLDVS